MADLAAGDVTFTAQGKARKSQGRRTQLMKIDFGDGAKTYPSGGVPLSGLSSQGFPNVIEAGRIVDGGSGSGIVWKYDYANNKLRAYQSPQHSHSLVLKNAAVADGATTRVNAGTNLLGANTGSDITVAGAGANGGVQNFAGSALTELGNVAVAAQTLYIEVSGY